MGPSINDVGNFSGFLTPPLPCRQFFSNIRRQFWPIFDPSPLPITDIVYGRYGVMIENNLNKKIDLRNVNFEKSGDNPGGIVQSFPFPGRWYNFQFLPCRKLFFELFVHLWSQLYHTRKTELVPVWWQKRKRVNNIIVVVDLLSECHFISVL